MFFRSWLWLSSRGSCPGNGELWGNRKLPVVDFSENEVRLRIAAGRRSSNLHDSEVQDKWLSRHVLSTHGSRTSGGLVDYRYKEGGYQEAGCYSYHWTVLDDDEAHELKEPRITPCSD